jgi:hypothetical protein
MALKFSFRHRLHGTLFESGHVYNFSYIGYQHDPSPLAIYLYSVSGYHPRTKHEWHFIQTLNLNYVSRNYRKWLVKEWFEKLYATKNVKVTWDTVKKRWPDIQFATRRYFYRPGYYIKNIKPIDLKNIENVVIGSLYKDFARQARIAYWTGIRKLQMNLSNILGLRERQGKQ